MSKKIEAVLITVNILKRIPFLNIAGPITSPISVPVTVADSLKRLGYPVVIHASRDLTKLPEDVNAEELHIVAEQAKLEADFAEEEAKLEAELQLEADKEAEAGVTTPANLTSDEPLDISPEEDDEDEEELDNEELPDTEELEVYPITHYKGWGKTKLVKYLQKAADYLTEEELDALEGMYKKDLIQLIEDKILSNAE